MQSVIVSQFSANELRRQLAGAGLAIRTGPVVNCIRSALPEVQEGISLLYADFPIPSADEFADFHFNVIPLRGIRRWLFPRAYFLLRGEREPRYGRFPPNRAMSFLEWGMNAAVFKHLNSYLILHAAVLERDGGVLLLLGNSGAGKSTLCAALALSGWRLFSDEMALVDLSDGLIHPIVRPISLKNESIKVIQRFTADALIGPSCHTKRKGLVAHMRPLADSVRKMDVPAPPRWIVYVSYRSGIPLKVDNIPRAEALLDLGRSSFNYHELGRLGFELLCQMLDRSICRRFHYGDLDGAVGYFNSSSYR